MDLNRLSKGERLAGIAALVLFISSFIPLWASRGYEFDEEVFPGLEEKANLTAWSGYGFTMTIAMLLALVIAALVIARAAGVLDRANLPVPLGLVYAGAGALILLIMLFSLLTGPEGINEVEGVGATYVNERGILLFLGILLAAATALGGFMHMRDEGSTPPQLGNVGRGTSGPTPPAT
ncbi:MAG: hypothetical protein M3198_07475 [Actinomycetota bacterium]|nr:hypothetical protein [Actinomycetota bacterium]